MFDPNAYFFNFYAIPNILVSTAIFVVGLFVFLQNPRNTTNIFFFLFCLSLNFWLYGRAIMYCCREPETALVWAKVFAKFGVVNIAPLVYAFSVQWLELYEKQKKFVIAGFIISFALYFAILLTPYGLTDVRQYFWGYYPVYGPIAKGFLVFFFTYFLAAFYNFFTQWKKTTEPSRRKQIRLVTIAYLISFTGSVDFIPKIINFPFYPWGYLSVFAWTMVLAYSIVRYRVMDIQTVVHKTIMWLLTSAFFAAPFVIFFYLTKEWLLKLNPAAFLGVIAIFYVLFVLYNRHVQPKIDHLFQRRRWDLMRALEKFTDELVHLRNLDEVVMHIINTVKNVFYLDQTSLFVREEDNFYKIGGKKGQNLTISNPFCKWLELNDRIIVNDYLEFDPRLVGIKESAKTYFVLEEAEICTPLVINKQLIGILNLGKKRNLQSYRADDLGFLSDLRRSAAIALSNALHIIAMQENLRKWNEDLEKKVLERTQQLQDTQSQLVQAEKLATIGTLAGGIAHEINNPLTAVLANAQILKMSANEDDRESLDLIEEGAKRCQIIIQKLMKYARKPTGPETMSMVDINKVVDSISAFLKYQLEQENIRIIVQKPQEVSLIEGNANELEQVITNLILNSKDAIKQAGREGEIRIKTEELNGCINIKVNDNGIGIPKEVLPKIFDPFFTTKEIGKGTGLGLAVSYGIIQRHNAKISVESELGKGTTFTISFR